MPAVHHKLLLEDALQDSPQVGLRVFVFAIACGDTVSVV